MREMDVYKKLELVELKRKEALQLIKDGNVMIEVGLKDLKEAEITIKKIEEQIGIDLPVKFPDKWHAR